MRKNAICDVLPPGTWLGANGTELAMIDCEASTCKTDNEATATSKPEPRRRVVCLSMSFSTSPSSNWFLFPNPDVSTGLKNRYESFRHRDTKLCQLCRTGLVPPRTK